MFVTSLFETGAFSCTRILVFMENSHFPKVLCQYSQVKKHIEDRTYNSGEIDSENILGYLPIVVKVTRLCRCPYMVSQSSKRKAFELLLYLDCVFFQFH